MRFGCPYFPNFRKLGIETRNITTLILSEEGCKGICTTLIAYRLNRWCDERNRKCSWLFANIRYLSICRTPRTLERSRSAKTAAEMQHVFRLRNEWGDEEIAGDMRHVFKKSDLEMVFLCGFEFGV